ncbi:protein-L-isoaspartate O-methyltransferase family protein [Microvirga roseola]|uniref:protein-L-isoaspartate O-methyltransferase family protein n=1 Tax=Microvirga roseola TaxID=2883126 RepID=UPI001E59EFE5|nr:SAM-dependent methyltransferase [Microvirga roseola]
MKEGINPDASRQARTSYASQILRLSGVENPRIEQAFATVPREAFLPPPPWTAISMGAAMRTSEVSDLYDNVLVAIDPERGINNGEPALHATWIAAVDPRPGENVIHVGAGMGYYTAILAHLVEPGGRVDAFEYEADLAAAATRNLKDRAHVAVHAGSAFGRVLPSADVIYVNAGVVAPDLEWLRALNPGGRLVFPWQPQKGWGPAVLVTRRKEGFSARSLMTVGFISCSGATARPSAQNLPTESDLAAVRSIWVRNDRPPDASAVAVYDDVWFSSEDIED